MPTPFTHLEAAQRLLQDKSMPQTLRAALQAERGAFLLGNVAADARVGSGAPREATHFYDYRLGITEHPWRAMMRQHSELMLPKDAAHRAFLAGYVAHLSMDEIWSLHMVGPQFAAREWAERPFRFYMLHIILIHMDERDQARLASWHGPDLLTAKPHFWLPFMWDEDLTHWQKLIATQLMPDGQSQTLEIFGARVGKPVAELRAFLDDTRQMQKGLWDHIAPEILADVEAKMMQHAHEQLLVFWDET